MSTQIRNETRFHIVSTKRISGRHETVVMHRGPAFGPFLDRAETEVHSADEAGATLAHARVLRAVEAVEAEYVANPRAFDPRVLA